MAKQRRSAKHSKLSMPIESNTAKARLVSCEEWGDLSAKLRESMSWLCAVQAGTARQYYRDALLNMLDSASKARKEPLVLNMRINYLNSLSHEITNLDPKVHNKFISANTRTVRNWVSNVNHYMEEFIEVQSENKEICTVKLHPIAELISDQRVPRKPFRAYRNKLKTEEKEYCRVWALVRNKRPTEHHHVWVTLARSIKFFADEADEVLDLQDKLLQNLLMDCRTRQVGILKNNYIRELEPKYQYLAETQALFNEAYCIRALSIDTISDFWRAGEESGQEDVQRLVDDYVDIHKPKNTIRLFVFSDAKSMVGYNKCLEKHFERYGAKISCPNGAHNAVLVCSSDTYNQYNNLAQGHLKLIHNPEAEDFAVLKFRQIDKDKDDFAEDHTDLILLAILSREGRLRYCVLKSSKFNHEAYPFYKRFSEHLECLADDSFPGQVKKSELNIGTNQANKHEFEYGHWCNFSNSSSKTFDVFLNELFSYSEYLRRRKTPVGSSDQAH